MKKLNKIFTTITLFLGLFMAINFTLTQSVNAASLAEIKKSGVVRIATEGVYPPYSYHDKNGVLVGYDVEIAQKVAQKLGLKAQFVEAPWDALVAGFDAGKSDIMFNQVSILPERKKKYDFTMPYTAVFGAVIVREDNNEIKSFADLKGRTAVNAATSNWAKMTEEYGAKLIYANGFAQEVDILLARRAEFVLNDDIVFYEFKKQHPKAKLKIAFKTQEPIYNAAIVKKGNIELLNAVNAALKELFESGEIAKISHKYFGADISKAPQK